MKISIKVLTVGLAAWLLGACGQISEANRKPIVSEATPRAEKSLTLPVSAEKETVPPEVATPPEVSTSELDVVTASSTLIVPPRMVDLPDLYFFHDRGYSGTLAISNGCLVFVDVGTKNGGVVLPRFDAAKVKWDGESLTTRDNTYSIGDRVEFGGNMGMDSWEHETCGTVTSATVRLK